VTGGERPPGPRNVAALLKQLREARFTGTVTVSGAPGGTFHLNGGLVGAVHTPGAPGAESLLLRSRRVAEDAWEKALDASRTTGGLAAALTGAGLAGAAELEVVCTAAVYDGAFAMALGPPGAWEVTAADAPDPALLARAAVEPGGLVKETSRRMALLARLWAPPADLARLRPRPTAQAETARLTPRHLTLLRHADGRRTPRDIAFATGRGVYPVLLDLARLHARDLVHGGAARPTGALPSAAPRGREAAAPQPGGAVPLPRRSPGSQLPVIPGPAARR
jgi:hypothetical protein